MTPCGRAGASEARVLLIANDREKSVPIWVDSISKG